MSKLLDLTDMRFGKLIVIRRVSDYISPKGWRAIRWECKCDCGNITDVNTKYLRNGKIVSCGCYHSSKLSQRNLKHGLSHTREHKSWSSMLSRCLDNINLNFHHYGGRGILVCERWMDFLKFLEDIGPRPEGHTLDRIDVNGNYEPSNCKWSTVAEQNRNKRNSKKSLNK